MTKVKKCRRIDQKSVKMSEFVLLLKAYQENDNLVSC